MLPKYSPDTLLLARGTRITPNVRYPENLHPQWHRSICARDAAIPQQTRMMREEMPRVESAVICG
jgi:hypothetical protein